MPNCPHTLLWQSCVPLQHSKATMLRTKGSSAKGTRALKALIAELYPSRTTHLHPPCTSPSCSTESYTVYFSKIMIGALIWKGGTHPTLARWCFSSGRGKEKSRALLITFPQINILLHQSSNSHQRGETSLELQTQAQLPISKNSVCLGFLITTSSHCPFQKWILCPRAPAQSPFVEGEMSIMVFLWMHNQADSSGLLTLHWLPITELPPLG